MSRSLGLVALVIPALFFAVLLCFFISSVLRNKDIIRKSKAVDTEEIRSLEDQHEKATLLNWMRRKSCGRFADTEGNHNAPNMNSTEKRGTETHHRFSLSTLFARNSLIPHIAPVHPPPLYAPSTQGYSSPTTSSPLARPLSECLPQRQGMLNIPRIFVPARRISLHSYSVSALPTTASMPRPQMAPHSASDSDAFASSGRASRLTWWLTVPSKAFLPAYMSVTDAGTLLDKATRTLSESTFSERDIRSNGAAFPF